MKLKQIVAWLNRELEVDSFSDVSNNGLQIAREGEEIEKVAFGVDASVAFFDAAAKAGAQLCVVHHGVSWGGGIRRLTGGEYRTVSAAIKNNLALYAVHLPLDASRKYGNNYELARYLGLKRLKPAFVYHGNTIGVTGYNSNGVKIGICSGGAGEFASAAHDLDCELFITGEANWADRIAAENIGMKMICAGHYETETFGVAAVSRAMKKQLGVDTVFIGRD